jgi:glutathionylspermidine synthase
LKDKWEGRFYFAALSENLEDYMTVNYLRDVAMQAGWDTEYINVEDIGWDKIRKQFVDLQERMVHNCFKLYPWEWMLKEEFGENLLLRTTNWMEPPWKSLLSNKGILPILSELYPKSEYLLQASFEPLSEKYIKKPLHGREGSNMEVVENGKVVLSTEGPYKGPFVYQEYKQLPNFDGNYPILGSWMVNGYACGLGIREDSNVITQNISRFVPHIFS